RVVDPSADQRRQQATCGRFALPDPPSPGQEVAGGQVPRVRRLDNHFAIAPNTSGEGLHLTTRPPKIYYQERGGPANPPPGAGPANPPRARVSPGRASAREIGPSRAILG